MTDAAHLSLSDSPTCRAIDEWLLDRRSGAGELDNATVVYVGTRLSVLHLLFATPARVAG
jgi:hypothetical protein